MAEEVDMKKPMICFKQNEDGVAAVEFALILPVLLVLVFGIINYGILLYDQAVITNAAREGARWGGLLIHQRPLAAQVRLPVLAIPVRLPTITHMPI